MGALRREGAANTSRAVRMGALRREGAANASRAVRMGALRREGAGNASRAVRVGEPSAGRARRSSGCALSAADRFIRKQNGSRSGRRPLCAFLHLFSFEFHFAEAKPPNCRRIFEFLRNETLKIAKNNIPPIAKTAGREYNRFRNL